MPSLLRSRYSGRHVTLLSTKGCSLELCIPFPLFLRTNNVHVTVSSCTNHISRYICRQRSRFPRHGSLLLIGQFKERNAELEWAAVSGEEHCVTTLITAAMILSDSFKFLPKGVNIRVAPTKNPRNNELRKRHNRVHSVNHHKAKTNTANTTPTPTLVNISPERKKKGNFICTSRVN